MRLSLHGAAPCKGLEHSASLKVIRTCAASLVRVFQSLWLLKASGRLSFGLDTPRALRLSGSAKMPCHLWQQEAGGQANALAKHPTLRVDCQHCPAISVLA